MTEPHPSQRLPSRSGNAELDRFFNDVLTEEGITLAELSRRADVSVDQLRRLKNYGSSVSIVRLERVLNSIGYGFKLRPTGKPLLKRKPSKATHPEIAKLLTDLVSPSIAPELERRSGLYSSHISRYYRGAATPGIRIAEELANAAGYTLAVEKIDAQQD